MNRFLTIIRHNAVLVIAALAAAVTTIFVPPDGEYLGYLDLKTLSCLFTVLLLVCALGNVRFFYTLAEKIVKKFKNARLASVAIIYVTFIGSMLIANDMALLTFLPLGYFVLVSGGKEKYMCTLFILQNIAANLGGMLTPFGNPQNLYLYSKFNIDTGEFMLTMLPPFLLSVAMITAAAIIFIKPEPLSFSGIERRLPPLRVGIYLVLFAFAILCVFKIIPYYYALIVTVPVILIMDRRALLQVDYGLLLTFFFFFIFSGNMSRISAVRELFSTLLDKQTLLFSTLSCQVISNVPSAILLSEFTDSWRPLLLGVNIGGSGTLIASLASLITFKEYTLHNPKKSGRYIAVFSAFNFAFLGILFLFCLLLV
jgi:Na+/H+ antiporter NhaD/arsenite permease-like protein